MGEQRPFIFKTCAEAARKSVMTTGYRSRQSHLFTLRMWREALGDGRVEVRGQVKHVPSSETIFFRQWSDLQSFVMRKLEERETADTSI